MNDKLKARLERIEALRQSILTDPGQRTLVRMLALKSEWMAQVIRAQDEVLTAQEQYDAASKRAVESDNDGPDVWEAEQWSEKLMAAKAALAKLLKEEWS